MNVMKSIAVARPRSEVYAFWRDVENLPRFMHHLDSVEDLGGGRSHWMVKTLSGKDAEWDAEIVEDRRGERISWRTIGADDDVRHAGSVTFRSLPDGATEVQVDLIYDAPGGQLGVIVARLFGEEPGQQIEEDLERFQRILETGDVERTAQRVDGADLSERSQRSVEPTGREFRQVEERD